MQLMGPQKNLLVFRLQPQTIQVLYNSIHSDVFAVGAVVVKCGTFILSDMYIILFYHCFVTRLQNKNFPVGKGINRRFEVFAA